MYIYLSLYISLSLYIYIYTYIMYMRVSSPQHEGRPRTEEVRFQRRRCDLRLSRNAVVCYHQPSLSGGNVLNLTVNSQTHCREPKTCLEETRTNGCIHWILPGVPTRRVPTYSSAHVLIGARLAPSERRIWISERPTQADA